MEIAQNPATEKPSLEMSNHGTGGGNFRAALNKIKIPKHTLF